MMKLSSKNIFLREGRISVFILVCLFINGCAGTFQKKNNLKLSLEVGKAEAWIDLMPGTIHSFHIVVDAALKNNESFQVDEVRIKNVSVYQGIRPVIYFTPDVKWKDGNSEEQSIQNGKQSVLKKILPGEKAGFNFHYSLSQFSISRLRSDERVNILISFASRGKEIASGPMNAECWIYDIEIKRTY